MPIGMGPIKLGKIQKQGQRKNRKRENSGEILLINGWSEPFYWGEQVGLLHPPQGSKMFCSSQGKGIKPEISGSSRLIMNDEGRKLR
jgi:hypothetical protein